MQKLLFLISLVFFSSCSLDSNEKNADSQIEIFKENDKVFIQDRTGKKWDVTSAVENFDMKADKFQFGLGPNAIPPIINPRILKDGEAGYPPELDESLIFGVAMSKDARAYSKNQLSRREVVDEKFGTKYVAVAYCPLADLVAVYSREIDGNVLTLAASGWTYAFTFVLYDYETESLWYPNVLGNKLECVSGFYEGRTLNAVSNIKRSNWNKWKKSNPETRWMQTN